MEETTKNMVMRETLKPPGTKKATIGGMIQTTVVGTEAIGTMKTPKNGTTTGAKKNVVVKTLTTMNVGTDVTSAWVLTMKKSQRKFLRMVKEKDLYMKKEKDLWMVKVSDLLPNAKNAIIAAKKIKNVGTPATNAWALTTEAMMEVLWMVMEVLWMAKETDLLETALLQMTLLETATRSASKNALALLRIQ